MPERMLERMEVGGGSLWVAVTAGIWLWAFHILFLSSFAEAACARPPLVWVFHAATLVTAAATAGAGWVCLALARRHPDDEAAGTVGGRTRFLGLFGLLTNAVSAALIVLEGLYVPFIDPCA